MHKKTKLILAIVVGLALAGLFLPRLARRIDATFDPIWQKASSNEGQYREMTKAYQTAAEMATNHPSWPIYEDRKAALLEAGYIETRDLTLKQSLAGKHSSWRFITNFASRFPGVSFRLRSGGTDQPATITVTARKTDFGTFGPIERFVTSYKEEPASAQ